MNKFSSIMAKASLSAAFLSLVACGGGSGSSDSDREINTPPVLSAPESISVLEDQQLSVFLTASDEDGDQLTFESLNLPSWMLLDSATGELTGTPVREDVGVFDAITVSVSDGTDLVLSSFNLEVIQAENLLILGKVTTLELPGAEVIVSVLDNTEDNEPSQEMQGVFIQFESPSNSSLTKQSNLVSSVVDENGEFEFNLAIPANAYTGDELLEIRVLGVEDQDHIELVSQVGDLDYVIETADDNDIVSAENLLRLNVSPISTALAVQTQIANGGEITTDWDLIQELERSLQSNGLIDLATDITALSNLPSVEIPFNQNLLAFITRPNISLENSLNQIFVLNNLFNVDGSMTQEFDALKSQSRSENINTEFLTDEFIVTNLIGTPIILSNEYILGGRPSILSANMLLNADSTGSLNTFQRTFITTTDLSWELSDGNIVIDIADAIVPNVSIFDLESDFGFNFDLEDFLLNRFLDGSLENRSVDLEFSEQRIVINALSQNELGVATFVDHSFVVNLDNVLAALNFEQEFPESLIAGELNGSRQIIFNTNLTFEEFDFIDESWVVPVLASFGVPLGGGGIDRSVHDLFEFNLDRSSGVGLLSGENFQWDIALGNLEIQTQNEEFTITPFIETQDEIYVLVDRINSLGERIITTDTMTRLRPENIEQFGQDFILPNMTPDVGLLWLSNINAITNPANFNSAGQIATENILGWGFPQNSNDQVSVIAGIESDLCLESRFEECFLETAQRDIEIQGSQIRLGFQEPEDRNIFRQNDWNVISYDPDSMRAIVLEFSIVEFEGLEGNIGTEPRINVLQLINLADYVDEYADSVSLFEVQE